jgi:xylan 1,4-beta-xylosidase
MVTRRHALGGITTGAIGAAVPLAGNMAAAATGAKPAASAAHATGPEGERRPDLGNGWYRNPIMPGDYPDPSILKDGDDYYMTHSSFDAAPGLIIWHSRDLVNWRPMGPALPNPLGTVFAVDIAKHNGRYYIYIPFMKAPWSKGLASFANLCHPRRQYGRPVERADRSEDRRPDRSGPCRGRGWQTLPLSSGINRVALSDDGLSTIGPVEKAYDGWHYPDEWVTEGYSLEGPKLFRRGAWFYLVSAVGGTSGPATSHMVIVARSKSVWGHGRTARTTPSCAPAATRRPGGHAAMPRWSRGRAAVVDGLSRL